MTLLLLLRSATDVSGTSATTLGDFTSSATGSHTPPAVTGTVASTLDDFTSAATGSVAPIGSAAVTLSAFTSSATGTFGDPDVFLETFDDDVEWRTRFTVADFRGEWADASVLDQDGQDTTQGNGPDIPDNARVESGRLVIECGMQNYGDTIARCNTPWAGTGIIEVDVLGDNVSGENRAMLLILDRPYPMVGFDGENANTPKPEYGIQFVCGASMGVPAARTWSGYVQTDFGGNGGAGGPPNGTYTPGTLQHWVIYHNSTHVWWEIDGDDVNVGNNVGEAQNRIPIPSGLTLAGSWIYLVTHNHASNKYTPFVPTTTNEFDNLEFEGLARARVGEAAPYAGPERFGWHLEVDGGTAPIVHETSSLALGTATAGWLTLNCGSDGTDDFNTSSRLHYRLNGNTEHEVAFQIAEHTTHDCMVISTPIDVAELVHGVNEVEVWGETITTPSANRYANLSIVVTGGSESLPETTGTVAATLDAFTSTASGTHSIGGTSATTLDAFTSTATGTAFENITGTSSQTLADFTSTASGTHSITGSSATTLDPFTSTAAGAAYENITGTSATTLDAFASSASGTADPPGVAGNAAVTLDDFTSSASGSHTAPNVDGSAAVTLDAFTSTATGTHVPPVSGTATITLNEFLSSGTGAHAVSGTAVTALDAFTAAATGTVFGLVTGAAAVTLDPFTSQAYETLYPLTPTGGPLRLAYAAGGNRTLASDDNRTLEAAR